MTADNQRQADPPTEAVGPSVESSANSKSDDLKEGKQIPSSMSLKTHWQQVLAVLNFIIVCCLMVISCQQYQLNEWLGRPWVGVGTMLGSAGVIGMCVIPDAEYHYGNPCKPKHSEVFNHISPETPLRAYIQVRNTGNSPALNTVLSVHWCVSAKKPSSPPTFEECDHEQGNNDDMWRDGPRVLFHGEGDSTLDVSATFRVLQSDIDFIKRRERVFYLIGRADYSGNVSSGTIAQHRTDFCIMYDPRGHGEPFSFYYCTAGNNAK